MKTCLRPIFLNGNYIPCYRCINCKSSAREKAKDFYINDYLHGKIKPKDDGKRFIDIIKERFNNGS